MKKMSFLFILLVLTAFWAFGDTEEQQEIDFLLFLPNSGSRFVNEERAGVQLDNLAKYLTGRELVPGQINVYGYTAYAANDIDPDDLSRARALFVINQLQRRGVPGDLFADPVGYGTVELWGSNTDEAGKSLNRRVRVVLDGTVLIPEPSTGQVPESDPSPPPAPEPAAPEPAISRNQEKATGRSNSKFPWWILLPLLLLLLLAIFLARRKKSSTKTPAPKRPEQPKPAPAAPPVVPAETRERVQPPVIPVVAVPPPVPAVPPVPEETRESVVYLEDEIRFRAYEHSLERNGQYGSMDEDWYKALTEICAKYQADGYQTYKEDGCWWARKTTRR